MKRTRKTDTGGDKSKSSTVAQAQNKEAESSKDNQRMTDVTVPNHKTENGQISQTESTPVKAVNGVQPTRHENGLSTKEDSANFEDIIHLTNHGNTTNGGLEESEGSIATKPILAFESDEPFLKKASVMSPQHVTEVL